MAKQQIEDPEALAAAELAVAHPPAPREGLIYDPKRGWIDDPAWQATARERGKALREQAAELDRQFMAKQAAKKQAAQDAFAERRAELDALSEARRERRREQYRAVAMANAELAIELKELREASGLTLAQLSTLGGGDPRFRLAALSQVENHGVLTHVNWPDDWNAKADAYRTLYRAAVKLGPGTEVAK